jgi:hypothetical protein
MLKPPMKAIRENRNTGCYSVILPLKRKGNVSRVRVLLPPRRHGRIHPLPYLP